MHIITVKTIFTYPANPDVRNRKYTPRGGTDRNDLTVK